MSIDDGTGVTRDEVEANIVLGITEPADGEVAILIEVPGVDDAVWWHEWSEDRGSMLAWAIDAGDAAGINLAIHRRT